MNICRSVKFPDIESIAFIVCSTVLIKHLSWAESFKRLAQEKYFLVLTRHEVEKGEVMNRQELFRIADSVIDGRAAASRQAAEAAESKEREAATKKAAALKEFCEPIFARAEAALLEAAQTAKVRGHLEARINFGSIRTNPKAFSKGEKELHEEMLKALLEDARFKELGLKAKIDVLDLGEESYSCIEIDCYCSGEHYEGRFQSQLVMTLRR